MQENKVWIVLFKKWNPSYKIFSERNIQAQWMLHLFKEVILPTANYQAITKMDQQPFSLMSIKVKIPGTILGKWIYSVLKEWYFTSVTDVACGKVNLPLWVYAFLACGHSLELQKTLSFNVWRPQIQRIDTCHEQSSTTDWLVG